MAPRRRQKKQSLPTSDPSTASKRTASALAAEKSRMASRDKVEKTIESKRILCLVPDIPENDPRRDYLKFTHYVDDDDDPPHASEVFDRGTAGFLFKTLQENPMMCVDFSFHQESDQGSEGDSASEDHDDSIPDEARLFQWKQSPNTNKWTCKFPTYSSVLAILYKDALGSTTTDAEHLRFISSRKFSEWASDHSNASSHARRIAEDFDLVILTESNFWANPDTKLPQPQRYDDVIHFCATYLGVCYGVDTYPPLPVARSLLLSEWMGQPPFSGLFIPQIQAKISPGETIDDFIRRVTKVWDKDGVSLERGGDLYVLKNRGVRSSDVGGVPRFMRQPSEEFGEWEIDESKRNFIRPEYQEGYDFVENSLVTIEEFSDSFYAHQIHFAFAPRIVNKVAQTNFFKYDCRWKMTDESSTKEIGEYEDADQFLKKNRGGSGAGDAVTRLIELLDRCACTRSEGKSRNGLKNVTCLASCVESPFDEYSKIEQNYPIIFTRLQPLPLVDLSMTTADATRYLPSIASSFAEYIRDLF
mmetsp:Transcript_15887/g.36488  ORF Transcript_15887/g.36488 Transcript_15887/m.36488 type:complete len:530 (-) Transcript_15887:2928-4517(-)